MGGGGGLPHCFTQSHENSITQYSPIMSEINVGMWTTSTPLNTRLLKVSEMFQNNLLQGNFNNVGSGEMEFGSHYDDVGLDGVSIVNVSIIYVTQGV